MAHTTAKRGKRRKALRGTISAEDLCALSGLTDRRHRQLGDQGFFPPPIKSKYKEKATIAGLFKFYREYAQRHHAAREGIQTEILRTKKRENDEAAGLLVLKSDVFENLQASQLKLKDFLQLQIEGELPRAMSEMGLAENRIVAKRVFDNVCEQFETIMAGWKV